MACTGNYYINVVDGTIQQQCNGLLAAAMLNAGFQGPYPTIAAAKAGVTPVSGQISSAANSLNPANALQPLADVGDFFHRLTEKNTWVRVGEVALGGILLWAGVKALSSGTAVGSVGSAAAKPVKRASRATAKVAIPEARVIGRTQAKRIAPKTTARIAKHRVHVAKYGAKKPYSPPKSAPVRQTSHTSHIYHHTVRTTKPKRVGP